MNKLIALFIVCLITFNVKAQETTTPGYQAYGKVDKADLELKSCDFEKDANAEILFANGVYERNILFRHIRIKIFNTEGVNKGSVRIPFFNYPGGAQLDGVAGFKAETINLDGDKISIVPVDKKLVYTEKVNKFISFLVFAFPAVKPGSIIEYEFSVEADPLWYFQSDLPCRYSKIEASFSDNRPFKFIPHINQSFFERKGENNDQYQVRALINIHSLPEEPYMGSRVDNLQRMEYISVIPRIVSWRRMGELLIDYYDFGGQFDRSLKGEDTIIKKAKTLKDNAEKVSYVFNTVKNRMKWNNTTNFATNDGTPSAWEKASGNSAEINLILYHLLKKSGIAAAPVLVGTKEREKINPVNPNLFSFNNTVVYVPVDTTDVDNPKYYILDATSKYNMFNEVPKDNLNTFGIRIDRENDDSRPIFMSDADPVLQAYYLDAEILANGKIKGKVQLNSFGYSKIDDVSLYKTKGEEKFKDHLTNNNNDLKILSLKMNNMEVDSLPLTQNIDFTSDLPGSDDNYIYFTPTIFFSPNKNPFLSETRYTDVDFKYMSKTLYSSVIKIPEGYKIDALPKDVSMIMPDTSITFRRTILEQNGTIVVRYSIYHKKTMYFQDEYPEFYQFFRKMYEMLNEQIVLKKS